MSSLEMNQVREQMLLHIQKSLEAPHHAFSGMPICPFARKARLQNKITIWVYPFTVLDWRSSSKVYDKIQDFLQQTEQDVLLVVNPDPDALSFISLKQLVEKFNEALQPLGLTVFGGHPDDPFEVSGCRTRQDPFINFTVQRAEKLRSAREFLAQNTNYYKLWDQSALTAINFESKTSP